MKDALVVLANTFQQGKVPGSRVLTKETELRVERAVERFAEGKARYMLMQGARRPRSDRTR